MNPTNMRRLAAYAVAIFACGAAAQAPAFASSMFLSNGTDVAVFAINNQSPGNPIATIASVEASGIAVDRAGHLLVTRPNHEDVMIYDTRTLRAVGRLSDPGQRPSSVAVGRDGAIYIGNGSTAKGGPGSVTVYARGTSAPARTLTCSRLQSLTGVAVNAHGDVFVNQNRSGSQNPEVDAFRRASPACGALSIPEYYYAGGLAIDPRTDDLLVADEGYDEILISPPPYRTVTQVITLPRCIGERVWDMTVDAASSLLYISDPNNGADVFNYPAGSRIATYYMSSAVGIAIAP